MANLTSISAPPRARNHSLTPPNASFGDKIRGVGKVLPDCSVQMANGSNKHHIEKLPDGVSLKGHTAQTIRILDRSEDHRLAVWYREIKVDIFVAES